MGDLHGVIVNDICEVVSREAVSFPDDEILFGAGFSEPLIHKVVNRNGGLRTFESHCVGVASRRPLLRFFGRQSETRALIGYG